MNNSSDISSLNDYNNKSDEPRLMNTNLNVNNFDENNNLKTTETDMLFQFLVNEDKAVPEEDRQWFNKDNVSDTYTKSYTDHHDDRDDRNRQDEYTNEHTSTEPTNLNQQPGYHPEQNVFQQHNHQEHNNQQHTQKNFHQANTNTNDVMLQKLDMLRKLGELTQHGVKLSQNYNMDSDLTAMEYEYNLHYSIRSKKNAVNWLSQGLVLGINGMETVNKNYNPFDFRLDGWGASIEDNIVDFYSVLGDLYEKYNSPGTQMSPEMTLAFLLAGSGAKYHFANSRVSNMTSMDEGLDSNPELREKLVRQATLDKLKEQGLKTTEALNNIENENRQLAINRMNDLKMLDKQRHDFMEEQRVKAQLANLQQELMKPVQQQQQQPVNNGMDRRAYLASLQQQSTIKPSNVAENYINNQHDLLRQQQILQHQQQMQQELSQRNDVESIADDDSSIGTINKDLDSILEQYNKSQQLEIDGHSQSMSEGGSSKVVIKRRKKKLNSKVSSK
jgi:hypothetical protein